MPPFPRTPEIACGWGHPLRPDGSHVQQADLEVHVWYLVQRLDPGEACVNAALCAYAGAPWHRRDSARHRGYAEGWPAGA